MTGTRPSSGHPGSDTALADACRYILEEAPAAFAVTSGPAHTLICANGAFRTLAGADHAMLGRPIDEVLSVSGLPALLDRAFNELLTFRNEVLGGSQEVAPAWICSVWPLLPDRGRSDGLVIELRERGTADADSALRRKLAERLLFGVLRADALAAAASVSGQDASFLADAGRQLAESINEATIHLSLAELRLPRLGSWCFVDIVEADGSLRRLPILHSDPGKQAYAADVEGRWSPQPGDPFGVPAVMDTTEPVAITDAAAAVASALHDSDSPRILEALGVGSLLTVPMSSHGRLLGAITFVAEDRGRGFTRAEVDLARELAVRGAVALANAQLYSEAVALRATAQIASRRKSEFLGHVSHEVRTPLDVIGGYIDLLVLEIHGKLNEAQRSDLDRIRRSHQHLLVMVNDILDFMQTESGKLSYRTVDIPVQAVVADAVAAVEAVMRQKELVNRVLNCKRGITVRADPDRTHQILVNLLTNAIKFTPAGGEITVECRATRDTVSVSVSDTGIGIPPERLEAVFEPFVQAGTRLTDEQGGVGLGLPISRELARAMNGDVRAQSTPGKGSRFTLSLPRAARA